MNCILPLALFLFASTASQAVIIFSTYDAVSTDGDSRSLVHRTPAGGQRVGVAFTTGADTFTLDSVIVNMSIEQGAPSDLVLSLYDNNGGSPGFSLGALIGPGIMNPRSNFAFTTSGLTLSPLTTYWICAEPGETATASFSWYKGTTPSLYQTSHASGSSWDAWGPATVITPAIVVNATPVPEPSTLVAGAVMMLLVIAKAAKRISRANTRLQSSGPAPRRAVFFPLHRAR